MTDRPFVDPAGDGGTEAPKRGALAHLAETEKFSMSEAIGGPRGMAESAAPGVVFVIVFAITKDLQVAGYAALGLAVAFGVVRLLARQTPQHAFSGVFGIAICYFLARRTGRAEDFYLPGLYISAGYAVAYLISILIRWPLVGVIVGALTDEGTSWRRDARRYAAYVRASWVWVGLYALKLAVQVPLYLKARGADASDGGAVALLGIARIAMGLPLFGLAMFLSWLILRKVPPATPDAPTAADVSSTSDSAAEHASFGDVAPTLADRRRDEA